MIGALPKALEVSGVICPIRTDFRVALMIFEAYNDPDIPQVEKSWICLNCLYIELPDDTAAALEQAMWFLNGGDKIKLRKMPAKVIDWGQDEALIFPAVNRVAGCETRELDYLHWWTFLGYFSEIGECLYSQVMNIRQKRAAGKKLEKWEREFLNTHKEMIVIHEKLTAEEQRALDDEQAALDTLVG